MEQESHGHPRVLLLLVLEGEPSDEQATAVRAWAEHLAASRTWSIPPPQLVDEVDADGIYTLGIFTYLLSSFPPWDAAIPITIDTAQLEEVSALISAVAQLSHSMGETFVVEYNNEAIGWIENGTPDQNISMGLLEEWRLSLAARGTRPAV